MEKEEPVLNENTLQLYQDYVGIKDPQELRLHLKHIQDRLAKEGKIFYRCIQRYEFAFSRIYHRFFYQRILDLGRTIKEPYFLDIGCCTGTDLRKLLLDGYPANFLVGLDIEPTYIDCGYALFRDKDHCPIQFIVGDVSLLTTQMSMIHAGSVFHLFSDIHMVRDFLRKLTRVLKPGGIMAGCHVCAESSTQYFRASSQSMKFYIGIHDFQDLLVSQGFTAIELETRPRISQDKETFTAFWVSFYAVYQPA
ncbi:hypothetical protein INT47_008540 [Mucor saturninus]|uniref:Methyltransferase domain-containing protein n=1 Tax=Mucor saturninus TaxID=64648 RepID=A0A8H7R9C5_9FUNG|nr:hypothetical protein INT47_008540 [Mucor saturninus]